MTELRTSFVINLAGNLQARARQYSQSIGRFAKEGNRHLNVMNRTARLASRGLDRLGNRYTALLSGAGIGASIRQVGRFNDRLLALGTQAGKTDAELDSLKQRIFEVANSPDIRADTSELLAAIEEIQTKTGEFDFAVENIENVGRALTATGAAGADIGGILARLTAAGIKNPREVLEILDALNEQGKQGAFLLKDTAQFGEQIFAAFSGSRKVTKESAKELGAVMQVIRQGTGSSEKAVTAFEALMRSFENADKVKNIEALSGVSLFEDDGEGGKRLRSLVDIMKELVVAADGDKLKLSQAFPDAEAMKAFGALVGEFKRTGSTESLDKFFNVAADGTGIMDDANRMAGSFQGSLNTLSTAWQQFSDSNLAKPIEKFAEWLNSVDQETVQNWLNIAKYIGIAGAGLVVASKGVALIANMRRAFGKGGAAGAAGSLAGSITPVPVYIVNGPGALGGGGKAGKPGKAGRAGRMRGLLGRAGGLVASSGAALSAGYTALSATAAGSAALVAGAGAAGYGAGTVLNKAFIEGTSFSDSLGRAIAKGMAALGNDNAQSALDAEARAAAMQGELQISVSDDRVRVRRMRSRGMDIGVETGRMMRDGS